MVTEVYIFSMKCFLKTHLTLRRKQSRGQGRREGQGQRCSVREPSTPSSEGSRSSRSFPTNLLTLTQRFPDLLGVIGNWCVYGIPQPCCLKEGVCCLIVHMEICAKEPLFCKRQMGEIFIFKKLTLLCFIS